jgi:hypothetical protein
MKRKLFLDENKDFIFTGSAFVTGKLKGRNFGKQKWITFLK